jgi:hypothetical protein
MSADFKIRAEMGNFGEGTGFMADFLLRYGDSGKAL